MPIFRRSPGAMPGAITIYQIGLAGSFRRSGRSMPGSRSSSTMPTASRRTGATMRSCSGSRCRRATSRCWAARRSRASRSFRRCSWASRSSPPFSSMRRSSSPRSQLPIFVAPDPARDASNLVQMTFVGTIYMLLSILWAAPFLAWVAGLSTLFRPLEHSARVPDPGRGGPPRVPQRPAHGRRPADRRLPRLAARQHRRRAGDFGAVIGMDSGGPLRLLSVILDERQLGPHGDRRDRRRGHRDARERVPPAAHRSLIRAAPISVAESCRRSPLNRVSAGTPTALCFGTSPYQGCKFSQNRKLYRGVASANGRTVWCS